jgi:hypothetical protein
LSETTSKFHRALRGPASKSSRFEFAHVRVTTPHSATNDLKCVITIETLIGAQNSSRR